MQIFLFIVFLLAVGFMRALPLTISRYSRKDRNVSGMVLALLIAIGFQFVYPLILNWFLNFLFGITLDYWIAFALLFVVAVFTGDIKDEREK